jgi:hypothetical protein
MSAAFIIGRFMPFYFAGSLESGNVCEYFRMKQFFNSKGIRHHDQMLLRYGHEGKRTRGLFSSENQA